MPISRWTSMKGCCTDQNGPSEHPVFVERQAIVLNGSVQLRKDARVLDFPRTRIGLMNFLTQSTFACARDVDIQLFTKNVEMNSDRSGKWSGGRYLGQYN
jgi:hypothetical protein